MSSHTPAADAPTAEVPSCPKCSGPMWDNREGKRNPKAPDFKCKDRNCDGVIWPPRAAAAPAAAGAPAAEGAAPNCPICGGPMWDDRASKRNPKAPDFKCKDKPRFKGGPGCEGVIWPPRDGERRSAAPTAAPRTVPPRPAAPRTQASRSEPPAASGPPAHFAEFAPPLDPPFDDDDDLPF